jgi:hypothetical protein
LAFRSLVLGMACVQLLGGPVARAAEEEQPPPPTRRWSAGIATGWYFPVASLSSPYTVGGGGVLLVGYQLSSSLSLRLEVNQSLRGGSPHDTWSLRATPEIKWDLGHWRLQPFVWTGVGLAYQATYPGPVSTATVVIPVGVGLQWNVDARSRLFVQASYDFLFRHLSVQSVPLVAGFEIRF